MTEIDDYDDPASMPAEALRIACGRWGTWWAPNEIRNLHAFGRAYAIALAEAGGAVGPGKFPSSMVHEAMAAAGLPVEAIDPIDGAAVGGRLRDVLYFYPEQAKQAASKSHLRGWFVGKVMAGCRGIPNPAFVAEIVDLALDAAAPRPPAVGTEQDGGSHGE